MPMTIAQAARLSGCPTSTIRYYERMGVLKPPMRGDNGYRYYDQTALERLTFVGRARSLGFSADAIANLLRVADHPRNPCDAVDHLLAEQVHAVRQKIDQLKGLETELVALQAACDGGHAVSDCGILAALSSEDST